MSLLPGLMNTGFFGGPGTVFAVQDFSMPTSGTLDVTSSAIAGSPKAALMFASWHLAANDPGETAALGFGFGATDFTTERAITIRSFDNQASTSSAGTAQSDVICLNSGTSGGFQVTCAGAAITGGVRLTHGGNDIGARRSAALIMTGADVSAKVGRINLGAGAATVTVSGVGFRPDVVIFFGRAGNSSDNTEASTLRLSLGVSLANETQRSIQWHEANGAAAAVPLQTLFTDRCGGELDGAGAATYSVIADNFGSDGFDVIVNADASSDRLEYLALKLTGRSVGIVDFSTPTSTGSQSYNCGFRPQFVLLFSTNLEALDTLEASTSDNQGGLGVGFLGDEQWASCLRMDSGADPTDTASNFKNVAILGASATSTGAISATGTLTATGFDLNYSAVQGNAKKCFAVCFQ